MRNITADIFTDEFFGTLSKTHRLLWLGMLLNIADDQGRMSDNVALMRSILFPYDEDVSVRDIEKGLALFAKKHKIMRYVAGTNGSGKRLIQIVNWWKYQRSAQWAARSLFPAPAKWADRIRVHETGGKIATINWDNEGGFLATSTKRLRSRNIADTKRLRSREDEDEVKDDIKRRGGIKKESFKTRGAARKKQAPLAGSKKSSSKEPRAFANLRRVSNGNTE